MQSSSQSQVSSCCEEKCVNLLKDQSGLSLFLIGEKPVTEILRSLHSSSLGDSSLFSRRQPGWGGRGARYPGVGYGRGRAS